MELATDEEKMYMEEALKEAALAALEGEIPVGAILVQDGRVIARNHNRRERAHDATAHAEILVIREACEKLRRWRLADSTLYVTMEPCPMCAGAIYNARIGRVVFGASDSVAGASSRFPSTPVSMQIPSSKPVSKQSAVKKFCRNFLHGAVNMI